LFDHLFGIFDITGKDGQGRKMYRLEVLTGKSGRVYVAICSECIRKCTVFISNVRARDVWT